MRPRTKPIWIGIARMVAIVAIAAAATEEAADSAPERIRILYASTATSFAPIWLASDLGLYRKQGLDAEAVLLGGGPLIASVLEDHRCHRRSAGDCQNPQPSGLVHPRPTARAGAAIRFIRNSLRADTRLPTRADGGVALSSSERRDLEDFAPRPTAAPPKPTEAKPQISLIAPTIDTFAGSALYLRSEKRWFKFPIQIIAQRSALNCQFQ